MASHRIERFVYEIPGDRSTLIRRQASMRGSWAHEARCTTCGLETRTGGATEGAVRQMVWEHKHDCGFGWYPVERRQEIA